MSSDDEQSVSSASNGDIPRPDQKANLPIPPQDEAEKVFAPILMDSAHTQASIDDISSLLSQPITTSAEAGTFTDAPANTTVETGKKVSTVGQITSEQITSEQIATEQIATLTAPLSSTNILTTNILTAADLTAVVLTSTLSISESLNDESARNNLEENLDGGGTPEEIGNESIRVERTVTVPILMYHYLSVPPADADIYRLDLSVTPDQFSRHLDAMLDAGYTTISLFDLWNHLENGAALPPKPVILTFDDGYIDNYENAFPLLIQRGMTATFFIVTDFIEEGRAAYITWEMVEEMYDAGMSIESHSTRHFSLKNRDDEFLVFEALRTKEIIEAKIGAAPRFISYPAGEYDQNTIDVFRSANYLMGVTTIQGSTHANDNYFELRRVRVRGTTDEFELLELLKLDW